LRKALGGALSPIRCPGGRTFERTPSVTAAQRSARAGALLGVMRAILDGQAPADADVHHAEDVLRLLGLTVTDAAEVARRPLPPLALSRRS
jgi:Tetracyclin repressor-like, C-terminal domain